MITDPVQFPGSPYSDINLIWSEEKPINYTKKADRSAIMSR